MKAKRARRLTAKAFGPRLDAAIQKAVVPRPPLKIRILGWLVPGVVAKWKAERQADLDRASEVHRKTVLKKMAKAVRVRSK